MIRNSNTGHALLDNPRYLAIADNAGTPSGTSFAVRLAVFGDASTYMDAGVCYLQSATSTTSDEGTGSTDGALQFFVDYHAAPAGPAIKWDSTGGTLTADINGAYGVSVATYPRAYLLGASGHVWTIANSTAGVAVLFDAVAGGFNAETVSNATENCPSSGSFASRAAV